AASSGPNRAALEHLAAALKTARQDQWLSDMLKAPSSPDNSAALKLLGNSRKASFEGKLGPTAKAASKAESLFSRLGNQAGMLRARLENVHSQVRHWNSKRCMEMLAGIGPTAAKKHYVWIEAQAWLEEVTCKTETRKAEVASEREQAYEWIKKTGYEALTLRALSFLTEDIASFDSRLTIWKRGHEGLKDFWNTPMRPERGFTFYYTLASSAQTAGDHQAAVALFEEGIRLLEQTGNQQSVALTLAYLGAWQWQAGSHEEAVRSFDRMEDLFRQLDKAETQESFVEAETIRAKTEMEAGNSGQALSRLGALTGNRPFPYLKVKPMHRRRLLPAYGDAYLQQGKLRLAAKCYNRIIDESRRDLKRVKSQAQRDNAQHEIETAWKGLTEVELRNNQVFEAWQTWEDYRGGRFQKSHSLSSKPPLGTSLLVYAFLRGGLWGWLVQRDGIEKQLLDAEGARKEAERLAFLAGDSQSQLNTVTASARRLYRLLIQPFAGRLATNGTLVVDADGPLAGIPWAALEDAQGQALVERFAIAQVTGWEEAAGNPEGKSVDLSHALIFGEPALSPELLKEYGRLPEAEREAKNLRARLPNAVLIEPENATADVLLSNLPKATSFHFAGHGVSYGGFGALLLAPGPEKIAVNYVTADRLAKLNLKSLRLAVLASCSSGVGEQSGLVNLDSLVRGFLQAGASRVVAARWNINSTETDTLMTRFYNILPRERPAEALRQAALQVRQTSAHPYYWAGLQVFGAP
ncbi:MAG TPA: CHAT domain-containing tetratricopeptide repeat protein, partial [Candidatus Angelobacter sp.]|nr:CHAT domain-containing tetratricopeptide repeat protein [Candidatus Angelobacter sp.]